MLSFINSYPNQYPVESIPNQLNRTNDLQKGDILLYRPSPEKNIPFTQKMIMFAQSLVHNKHGHYDTTHVAICVGHNSMDEAIIVHMTTPGFTKDVISDYGRNNGYTPDRPMIVYRHHDVKFSNLIADNADRRMPQAHKKNQFHYHIPSLFKATVTKVLLNPDRQKIKHPPEERISANTFCSKFAIQVLKKAATTHGGNFFANYPHIRSNISPKALESYLATNNNYQRHVYPGRYAVQKLFSEINSQINRIGQRKDNKSQEKYQQLLDARNNLKLNDGLTEFEKIIKILILFMPIFKQSTGLGFCETTSYKSICNVARKMGAFRKDFETDLPSILLKK